MSQVITQSISPSVVELELSLDFCAVSCSSDINCEKTAQLVSDKHKNMTMKD